MLVNVSCAEFKILSAVFH